MHAPCVDEEDLTETLKQLARYHAAIVKLNEVMVGVLRLIHWQDFPLRQRHIYGYFTRAHGWIQSLTRLDRPSDLQAIASAARTMIETVVEMLYIHMDPTDATAQRIVDWEQSEKLRWAMANAEYYKKLKILLPEHDEDARDFICTNEKQIEGYRLAN